MVLLLGEKRGSKYLTHFINIVSINDIIQLRKNCIHTFDHLHSIICVNIEVGKLHKEHCYTFKVLKRKLNDHTRILRFLKTTWHVSTGCVPLCKLSATDFGIMEKRS